MITLYSIIFDVVILAIIVLAGTVGKKKGLLMMVFSVSIVFIAIIIARISMPVVCGWAEKLSLGTTIKAAVSEKITEECGVNLNLEEVLGKLNLPETLTEYIEKNVEDAANAKGAELAEKLSDYVAKAAIKLISYAAVALIVIVVLVIIACVLKLARNLPLIEKADKLGGSLVGGLLGICVALIVCIAVYGYGIVHGGTLVSEISGGSLFVKLFDSLGIIGKIIK